MIKLGILGYGNLGRGVENAMKFNKDMELCAIFTRRNPETVKVNSNTPVVSVNDIEQWKDKLDVLIICGGSATDLPVQTPKYAEMFNVIDSFDTHARIPEHFANVVNNAPVDELDITIGANEAKNVFRKDEIKVFKDNEALLQNAPEQENNMFKIPKVIN